MDGTPPFDADDVFQRKDYLAFKQEMVARFGEVNQEQIELLFAQAVAQAQDGLLASAANDGKFALALSEYARNPEYIYILGFLCQLHIGMGKIAEAWQFYHFAEQMLDTAAIDYADDRELFNRLLVLLQSEDWKRSLEDKE